MNLEHEFHAYSLEHLVAISIVLALPFALAWIVKTSKSSLADHAVIAVVSLILLGNYLGYLVFIRRLAPLTWTQMLPMQMCDWALAVIMVALWTKRPRWFEVAYFWGIGGTLQAILTPNLQAGFPDLRFIAFFVAHGGIIVGVVYLMLTRRLRPTPLSIARVFAWSEVYFVVALAVDLLTGVNYGFLLHKPEAFSLLSLLSDSWPLYLLQMHGLALVFFAILYLPFAVFDLVAKRRA